MLALKNWFKIFYKNILLLFLLILFTSTVVAFPVNAPNELEINTKETFFLVEVTNPYEAQKDLVINFFAPTHVQISAPKTISGNSSITAKIFVRNDFLDFEKINSTLEVFLGDELEKREISLRFYPTNVQSIQNNPVEGFFAFVMSFNIIDSISMEFGLIFLLSLIVIALLLMLIFRISRRV